MTDPQTKPPTAPAPGEMASRILAHDWQATPLGPLAGWPQALRHAVDLMLASSTPMAIHWGQDLVLLHNDAWLRLAGGGRPGLLGTPSRRALASAWPRLSPLFSAVMAGSGSMRAEGEAGSFGLEGGERDRSFTFSLEPIPAGDGTVGGVLSIGLETRLGGSGEDLPSESETRHRAMFGSIDQGYALCRLVRDDQDHVVDYRFLQVGGAFEAFTGLAPSEVVGRLRSEAIPGRDERTLAATARVIATGQPVRIEFHNGGLGRWYDVGLYPRGNDRFAALFSDITERKRQEGQLRAHEARHRADLEREVRDRTAELARSRDLLQATMDSSLDMIQVFEAIRDADGRIVDFRWLLNNHTSESRYGVVEGESLLQRNPGVVVEGIFESFVRVTETGIPEQAERHYAHEQFDGWFYQSVVRLGDGVATTTKDISEWKAAQQEVIRLRDDVAQAKIRESEESLRTAAEVGRLGLWDWNVTTGEVSWSDAHFRMEGYAVGEVEPSYAAWVARLHPEDRAETEEALKQAMQRHEDYVREFRVVHPDGAVHWLYGRGRFFYDETGRPTRMVGAMIDVTERKELEDRLQVLVLELQHRTRNLMGVVRSLANSTLRSSRSLDEFQTTFLDRLAALARVNGLLSRLNEGDRIHLEELLEAELWALGLMDANRSRITLEGPHGVRLRSGTVQTFALALHELATNAVKYGAFASPRGSLAIRWELAQQDGGTYLNLEWKERGVAMPSREEALRRTGYGRELIERALPYQLKAKTAYELEEDGVRCTIMMPISEG